MKTLSWKQDENQPEEVLICVQVPGEQEISFCLDKDLVKRIVRQSHSIFEMHIFLGETEEVFRADFRNLTLRSKPKGIRKSLTRTSSQNSKAKSPEGRKIGWYSLSRGSSYEVAGKWLGKSGWQNQPESFDIFEIFQKSETKAAPAQENGTQGSFETPGVESDFSIPDDLKFMPDIPTPSQEVKNEETGRRETSGFPAGDTETEYPQKPETSPPFPGEAGHSTFPDEEPVQKEMHQESILETAFHHPGSSRKNNDSPASGYGKPDNAEEKPVLPQEEKVQGNGPGKPQRDNLLLVLYDAKTKKTIPNKKVRIRYDIKRTDTATNAKGEVEYDPPADRGAIILSVETDGYAPVEQEFPAKGMMNLRLTPKNSTMKPLLVFLVILALLGGIGYGAYLYFFQEPTAPPSAPPPADPGASREKPDEVQTAGQKQPEDTASAIPAQNMPSRDPQGQQQDGDRHKTATPDRNMPASAVNDTEPEPCTPEDRALGLCQEGNQAQSSKTGEADSGCTPEEIALDLCKQGQNHPGDD